jgi:small-conductance mechanosensitive channel
MTHMRSLVGAAALSVAFAASVSSQTPIPEQIPSETLGAAIASASKGAVVTDPPATLVVTNRPVIELRATVVGRSPSVRVNGAADRLQRLLERTPDAIVSTRVYSDAIVIRVGEAPLIVVFQADLDALAGEQLEAKTSEAARTLQMAINEAAEFHHAGAFSRAVVVALLATVLFVIGLWFILLIDRRVSAKISRRAESKLLKVPGFDAFVKAANMATVMRRAFGLAMFFVGLVFTYAWLTVVLKRFPYTRPWGESLGSGLRAVAGRMAQSVVDELPNLLMVLVIVLITRFVTRVVSLVFIAAEEGRVSLPYTYPETAQSTRRIAVALLWVFAFTIFYNYLPGSGSDAFKGISVFLGLMVSIGSSGIVNQLISGMMVTYARALRVGDFVKIDDIEGTVTHLGALSSKIKTLRNEEITLPNAIIASSATTNFSRLADTDGVFTPTTVTIGYDTPWRQIQALLMLAAERTAGIRSQPKPFVLQTALDDFYVRYTLLVCLQQPQIRGRVLGALHANIQDAFNEYGVQIMSPGYEADPDAPKIVPPSRWYAAPAAPAASADAVSSSQNPT